MGRTLVANRLLAGSACGKRHRRGRPLNSVVRHQSMSATDICARTITASILLAFGVASAWATSPIAPGPGYVPDAPKTCPPDRRKLSRAQLKEIAEREYRRRGGREKTVIADYALYGCDWLVFLKQAPDSVRPVQVVIDPNSGDVKYYWAD